MPRPSETFRKRISDVIDVKVEIEEEGKVWIYIGSEILDPDDLGKIVDFVEYHAKVTVVERDG